MKKNSRLDHLFQQPRILIAAPAYESFLKLEQKTKEQHVSNFIKLIGCKAMLDTVFYTAKYKYVDVEKTWDLDLSMFSRDGVYLGPRKDVPKQLQKVLKIVIHRYWTLRNKNRFFQLDKSKTYTHPEYTVKTKADLKVIDKSFKHGFGCTALPTDLYTSLKQLPTVDVFSDKQEDFNTVLLV